MFALPGLLAIVTLEYLRPQEFFPALRGIPMLHAATALSALGFVVDLKLGLTRLRPAPHLLLSALFILWCLATLAVRLPMYVVPRAIVLSIPFLIYLFTAHAVQGFRMLEAMAALVLALSVTLSGLGLYQAWNDKACYRVTWTEFARRWHHDGRPCLERADCENEDAEPGFDYVCENVGFMGRSSIGGRVRWVGTMEDPNELSMMISVALPFAFAFYERRRTLLRGLLMGACAVAIGLCTYYTRSRGGQLVFLAVLGIYFVQRVGLARGFLAGIALATPIILFGGRGDAGAAASTAERTETWWIGLHLFQWYPFAGVGSGLFGLHHYLTAHSSYILAGAELGIPGLLIFTSILYTAAKIPFQALRADLPAVARHWAIALLAGVAGLAVGVAFLSFNYKIMLWIFLALPAILYHAIRQHQPSFEVKFGLSDLALVAAADVVLIGMHVLYTGLKLGW